MLKLAIILLVVLFASPSYGMNDFQGEPLSKIEEMAAKHGVVVEKLSEVDTATLDAVTAPRPKPSMVYLLTLGESVIIVLVNEGVVVYSTNPVELNLINRALGRSGA